MTPKNAQVPPRRRGCTGVGRRQLAEEDRTTIEARALAGGAADDNGLRLRAFVLLLLALASIQARMKSIRLDRSIDRCRHELSRIEAVAVQIPCSRAAHQSISDRQPRRRPTAPPRSPIRSSERAYPPCFHTHEAAAASSPLHTTNHHPSQLQASAARGWRDGTCGVCLGRHCFPGSPNQHPTVHDASSCCWF